MEDWVGARLDGQVEVLADRGALGHRGDEPRAEVPGMRRHEAEARDERPVLGVAEAVDRAQERRDVRPAVERHAAPEVALRVDPREARLGRQVMAP